MYMSPTSHKNRTKHHTVVLRSKSLHESQPLIIGSKQEYLHYARGSPPTAHTPVVARALSPPAGAPRRQTAQNGTCENRRNDLLVCVAIDTGPGRMVTRLLIALIFFQPLYLALGMEIESDPETVFLPDASALIADDQDEPLGDTAVHEGESPEQQHQADVSDSTQDVTPQDEKESDTEAIPVTEESVTVDEFFEEGEVGVPSDDESGALPEEAPHSGDGARSEHADENEEAVSEHEEEVVLEEGAVTKDPSLEGAFEDEDEAHIEEGVIIVAQNPTNKYVFGEGDCTLVSDGEFYCIAKGPERQRHTGVRRVYAEKDRKGDREIFYFDGIEVRRITNNNYDDFAPVFDESTMHIVWQAMINDRLQIMLHELSTNVTRQITTTRENSSNPSISGDIVVWQEWVDTNWEIMMTNVNNNGQPFDIVRLTDNVAHDMFPVAYDGMVTWQRERGSGWEIIVYETQTGKKHVLEKGDAGARYENPRFALIFDSKHDNGDIKTVGYDLSTGDMMDFGTRTKQVPLDPVTPKDETPEAVVREVSSTTQVRVEGESDPDLDDDDIVVL